MKKSSRSSPVLTITISLLAPRLISFRHLPLIVSFSCLWKIKSNQIKLQATAPTGTIANRSYQKQPDGISTYHVIIYFLCSCFGSGRRQPRRGLRRMYRPSSVWARPRSTKGGRRERWWKKPSGCSARSVALLHFTCIATSCWMYVLTFFFFCDILYLVVLFFLSGIF